MPILTEENSPSTECSWPNRHSNNNGNGQYIVLEICQQYAKPALLHSVLRTTRADAFIIPTYEQENCTTEQLSNLPKVTQLVRGGVKPRLEFQPWNPAHKVLNQTVGLVEVNATNERDSGSRCSRKK